MVDLESGQTIFIKSTRLNMFKTNVNNEENPSVIVICLQSSLFWKERMLLITYPFECVSQHSINEKKNVFLFNCFAVNRHHLYQIFAVHFAIIVQGWIKKPEKNTHPCYQDGCSEPFTMISLGNSCVYPAEKRENIYKCLSNGFSPLSKHLSSMLDC